MSHKCRSIANTRSEAKRIYYQRRIIKKLSKRDEKLKRIEDMFIIGTVDLEELRKIVLEVE